MSATVGLDLKWLLGSVEPEIFFRDSWEQQPLVVSRSDPEFYRDLFTRRDVDRVIAFTRPLFPESAELKPAGPRASFVRGMLAENESPAGHFADLPELHRAYAHGKTVIINSLERRWPAVAAMNRNLEAFFGCRVHTNLYLTPPGAQGFGAHYDPDENFILQIDGSKHWRFYGPARELPLLEEKAPIPAKQLATPTLEALLQPGDLLYIPRGHVHEAFTSDTSSLHLTVAVRVYRWVDLLQRALARAAASDIRFRQSLPIGLLCGGEMPPSLDDQFRELLRGYTTAADLKGAVAAMADAFVAKLAPLPHDYFADDNAGSIQLDTPLERAAGVICRVEENCESVTLQAPGARIDGPAEIAPALRYIARNGRFTPRALPGDLSAEVKLALARRLLRERLITRALE
jgi:lysine-specific demethylase/histidyl-hydroxylase NO66